MIGLFAQANTANLLTLSCWKEKILAFCIPCNELLSLEHMSLHCSDLPEVREKYFHANSLRMLFSDFPLDCIFDFLKEVNAFLTSCLGLTFHNSNTSIVLNCRFVEILLF